LKSISKRQESSHSSKSRNATRLSYKFTLSIVAISFGITLLGTSLLSSIEYRNGVKAVHLALEEIQKSHSPGLSEGLWDFDAQISRSIANGIVASSDIARVEVYNGETLYVETGVSPDERMSIKSDFPLTHSVDGEPTTIGKVTVYGTLANVRKRLFSEISASAVLIFLLIFPLAVFTSLLFKRLVGRQLQLMNEHFNQIDADKLETKLTFEDDWGTSQEFEHMERSINDMSARLSSEIERQISAETELRRSEERSRAVVENSVDAILVSHSGLCTLVNPAALRMFGYEREEELLGCSVLKLIAVSERDRIMEYMFGSRTELAVANSDHTKGLRKDGSEFDLEVKVSQYGSEGNMNTLAILRDVTDRIRLEEQLRQSHKVEAIGTLAGGIAHDFNNILEAIMGYTQLAKENTPADSDSSDDLKEVLKAAERATDLVRQILTFSRKGEVSKKVLQIHPIIEEASKLLRQTIPSTIDIKTDLNKSTGNIMANATEIHQIVMNLGTNAYHSMRDTGGEMYIVLESVLVDQTIADEYPELCTGRFARLRFRDTGAGMDQATMSRIFDPFFTTKLPGEGTGMGLSVVHGIIKNHGGSITVESTPGFGTTFNIFLPLDQREVEEIADTRTTALVTGNEHILFVDDEPALLKLGKRMLESVGHRVTALSSSQETLATFKENPDSFDLLLTDQTMPGMTGDVLAREVLKVRPGLPVVICTGYSDILDETQARANGFAAVLLKPISQTLLSQTIRRILDERSMIL
jgi:PAS domain S-box-containing protein